MSNRMKPMRMEPGRGVGKRQQEADGLKALNAKLQAQVNALVVVVQLRERELRDLKGPCENMDCALHFAHLGQCRITDR